jgi:hypothetical protein
MSVIFEDHSFIHYWFRNPPPPLPEFPDMDIGQVPNTYFLISGFYDLVL